MREEFIRNKYEKRRWFSENVMQVNIPASSPSSSQVSSPSVVKSPSNDNAGLFAGMGFVPQPQQVATVKTVDNSQSLKEQAEREAREQKEAAELKAKTRVVRQHNASPWVKRDNVETPSSNVSYSTPINNQNTSTTSPNDFDMFSNTLTKSNNNEVDMFASMNISAEPVVTSNSSFDFLSNSVVSTSSPNLDFSQSVSSDILNFSDSSSAIKQNVNPSNSFDFIANNNPVSDNNSSSFNFVDSNVSSSTFTDSNISTANPTSFDFMQDQSSCNNNQSSFNFMSNTDNPSSSFGFLSDSQTSNTTSFNFINDSNPPSNNNKPTLSADPFAAFIDANVAPQEVDLFNSNSSQLNNLFRKPPPPALSAYQLRQKQEQDEKLLKSKQEFMEKTIKESEVKKINDPFNVFAVNF